MPVATIADLPLELVEEIARHLDVKDVLELMMVNKKLYSSYAMDQSIVFGKHVAEVLLLNHQESLIKKFVDSPCHHLNACLPHAKRVGSCDELNVNASSTRGHTDVMFLGQLKSVNQLWVSVYSKEDCLEFLANFCGSVRKEAQLHHYMPDLTDSLEEVQATRQLEAKFIEKQLNRCEKIGLTGVLEDCFHVFYEVLMKTQIKIITMGTYFLEFEKIVDLVVNQGIPSKNSEAVFRIATTPYDSRVVDFLSKVQGLERVNDGENHSAIVARADELIKVVFKDVFRKWLFEKNSTCFRRRIEPAMYCIYVYVDGYFDGGGDPRAEFFAFYMPSQ